MAIDNFKKIGLIQVQHLDLRVFRHTFIEARLRSFILKMIPVTLMV